MKEGHPIGLSDLVKDLKGAAQAGPEELGKAVKGMNVVYPDNAQRGTVSIGEVSPYNAIGGIVELGRSGKKVPGNYIGVHLSHALPEEEFNDLLNTAIDGSKTLRLPKGKYVATLEQAWEPQDFKAESGLLPLRYSRTSVTSETTTINPENVRMVGHNKRVHTAIVEMAGLKMTIGADGEYRNYLSEIIEAVRPQYATIQFSQNDAERVIEEISEGNKDSSYVNNIKKLLEPKSRRTLRNVGNGIGLLFIEKGLSRLTIRTRGIPDFQNFLHKELINPPDEQPSCVVELKKVYSPLNFLIDRRFEDMKIVSGRFEDMKIVAGILEQINFVPIREYEISPETAKELLDKELDILQKAYKDDIKHSIAYGENGRIQRGNVVKRLAGELLGSEVVEPLDKLDVMQYVQLLTSKGYLRGGYEVWNLLPPSSLKERHLLEFYLKVYKKDPMAAAMFYREGYVNTKPKIIIDAVEARDGAKIAQLKVAPKARVYAFGVEESESASGFEVFSYGKDEPKSNNAQLMTRTNLKDPKLLPLQGLVSDRVGISFR